MNESTHKLTSTVARLSELEIGQAISISQRLEPYEVSQEAVSAIKARQNNTLSTAMKRAKTVSGFIYKIESGDWRSQCQAMFVTTAITRMA